MSCHSTAPPQAATKRSVQVFGRKKTAIALGHAQEGVGLIKINGTPLELLQPETLRTKVVTSLMHSRRG